MATIYAGGKPIKGLGKLQYNMATFALLNPGWHSLGGSGHPNSLEKRLAKSLEKRGCLEIDRHSGEYGHDWQFRWKQQFEFVIEV